jgi:alpha-N-arabinofuranosidase
VDNNLFLSSRFLRDKAQGGAYVHNLATGDVELKLPRGRGTPFLKPHSTEMVGLHDMPGGDDRFYNNICIGHPELLSVYDRFGDSIHAKGNVFLMGAKPPKQELNPLELPKFNPGVKLLEKPDGIYLRITLDESWAEQKRPLVTTELLGKAKIPGLPFVQPDGSPYRIDTDYFGNRRNAANPYPGPFELPQGGTQTIKVWPLKE